MMGHKICFCGLKWLIIPIITFTPYLECCKVPFYNLISCIACHLSPRHRSFVLSATVKILKFGTPQTIAIIVLKIEKFDVTLH